MVADFRRRPLAPKLLTSLLLAASLLSPGLSRAQEATEVTRVRIPSRFVAAQFPPDTPLMALTPEAFEELLARVAAADRDRARGGPRLVRARHSARFSPGLLTGKSELVLAPGAGEFRVPIEPWSPAILSGPKAGAVVAASASGEASILVEPGADGPPGEATVTVEWELRSRPDSRGRIFALALPGEDATTFTLDVPAGWEPTGASGHRDGPTPGDAPGRESWRFSGRVGAADLRLTHLAEARESANPARIWVAGPTRIDLRAASASGPAANFTTDWTLQGDEPGADSFAVEIAPGLDLLGVEGPTVREYRIEEGSPPRAVVTLAAAGSGPAGIRFLGHARAPTEGAWTVPSIRPLSPATWTGGSTTIILDDGRVVRDCREIDGRRVPPPADSPSGLAVMVFESAAPGPPAELSFRPPGATPTATVLGRLTFREASTRLECEVDGVGATGTPTERTLELPPGWVVDRVEVVGSEEVVAWNQSKSDDGSSLLRLAVAASGSAPEGRTIRVGATATDSPRFPRTMALPRVRPTGCRIADEAWIVRATGRVEATPGETKGLAWIDPSRAPNLLPPTPPADLRTLLAWRWTAPDGTAPVEVRLAEPTPTGRVHVRARVNGDGSRLDVAGRAESTSAATGAMLWIDSRAEELAAWSFVSAATGEAIAPAILPDRLRRRQGFPEGGVAVELPAGARDDGRVAVEFRASYPWGGSGRVPLVALPPATSPTGVAVVETPSPMRSLIEGEGLGRVEAALADRLAPGPEGDASPPGWSARALTYAPGARMSLRTEGLRPEPSPGLIRGARLATRTFPGGRSLNRLRLLVAADQTASLTFRMPDGAKLAAARVDGRRATPAVEGDAATIPLPSGPGERARAVELDYRAEPSGPVDARRLRPVLPDFGVPCLSFSWELALPAGESVVDPGPGLALEAADPRPAWPFEVLGLARRRWPGERPAARSPREDVLRRLDDLLGAAPSEDLTFADLFTRWDAGPTPVVIDRSALADEGVGPRTRCGSPPAAGAVWRSVRILQRLGLTIAVVDDALVVTSRRVAMSSAGPATWRGAVGEALMWGEDEADRFQSASRWRGEPSAEGDAGRRPDAPGRETWRLCATSWPGPDAVVVTADDAARAVIGWGAALAVFAIGLRRATAPRRGLIAPLGLMVAAVVVHDWWEGVPPEPTAGVFAGAFAVLMVRLGRLLRATLRGPRADASAAPTAIGSTLVGRRAFRVGVGLLAAFGLSRAVGSQAPGPDAPILALIPYDGEFDPDAPPSRVILRREDHDRLRERATPPPGPLADGGPIVVGAEHRLERGDGPSLTVVSEYALRPGEAASRFVFPVGDVYDIGATVDGVRAPVIVEPGGASAAVVAPAGATRVSLRRSATPTRDGDLEALELEVNRAPFARLTLEQPAGSAPPRELAARGRVVATGDRPIEALLGPVDRLSVCWSAPGPAATEPSATVESLMLWDLDPAGERVRARLTYRPRRRTSTIAIGLEPGLVPRAVDIPGLVDTTWGGTPENPEWIAHVDPPLPERATISLDFWRPLDRVAPAGEPGSAALRFPRVEPLGVDRESGLLAARRPGRWSGRLTPSREAEAVEDETFVRAWGALPDDALTFAGTVRHNGREPVEFLTGPIPSRSRRRPAVRVVIDSGRIDWRCDLEVSEISGLMDRLDVDVPGELVVLGIESLGLTDWSREPGGPLRARFDRIDLKSRRTVRIRGWIPVSRLVPGPGPRRHRLRLPWVDPGDGAGSAGTLEVFARGAVELATTAGGASEAATVAEEVQAPSGGPWIRKVYRVDDPKRVGELSWAPSPPRSNVTIGSQLTIHPDSAEWVAVLRYDVVGGPLEAIQLRLPPEWAARGRIQAAGRDQPLVAESHEGSTDWTITPDRPVWGSRRLVLRSRLPIQPGREVAFPTVAPLGLGVVDASLALVFATSTLPAISGTAGLRSIPYASRFQDAEFGGAIGLAPRAYHVDREGWTLTVQAPPGEPTGPAGKDSSAGVRSADVSVVVRPDGSALGLAEYQAEPRTGRFLTVAPPGGARLIRAAVDGAAVGPLLDAEDRWTIPLGDSTARQVSLVWSADPPPPGARGPALPRAGDGRAPALVTVHAPPEATVLSTLGGLEGAGPERIHLERADRIAARALDLVAEMDRGSGRDRARLVALLIDHESTLREAEHALLAASRGPDRARRERATRDLEVVKTARDQLAESLRAAGMEEAIAWAREALGLPVEPGAIAPTAPVAPEATDRERIRLLGRPAFFVGVSPGLADPPARLELSPDRAEGLGAVSESRARSLLLLALLLGLGLAGLTSARQAGAQCLIAAACLSLAAVAGGPLALGASAAVLIVGWLTRPPAPRGGGAGAWI
ncbi:hypothetical protein [Paludisphaera sp.]|uniref:hypothetical protein n=1 Tax=Paludisphaera sp. TaxID=2017432 RepID=UPI00301DA651